jgi:hypothetical protein
MATANSYFLRGRWSDADDQYELLRKDYPRSDHQYAAHLLGLRCKMHIYQGPDYDGTPLEEAQQIVKQLKVQFGGQLDAKQREELAKVDGQLNHALALRDFRLAQHFENIEQYGSARYLFAQVMRKHPQTPLADQSRERLVAMQGLPDQPSSMFDPVLDMLPESSERTAIAQVPVVPGAHETRVADADQPDAPKEGETQGGQTITR